jgi:hypothetical protein
MDGGMTDRLTIRVSAELVRALDQYISVSEIPIRSRQEAFRQIAWDWLGEHGFVNGSDRAEGLLPIDDSGSGSSG